MTDILVGVVAFTAALTMYALGMWQGRRSERNRAMYAKGVLWTELAAANRRADKYRLAWLSARRRAHRGRLLADLLREQQADQCPECGHQIGFVDLYGGGREYMCPACQWSVVIPEEFV